MIEMALFDCAINEKCCNVDGGRGICPLFSFPPWGIWQLKSPHPGNLPCKVKKKMLLPGVSPRGRGGGVVGAAGIDWCISIMQQALKLGSKTLHKQQSAILYILRITDPFFGLIKTTTHQRRTTKCVCNIVFHFVYGSVENAVLEVSLGLSKVAHENSLGLFWDNLFFLWKSTRCSPRV